MTKTTVHEVRDLHMINAQERGIWYLRSGDGQIVALENEVLIDALIEGIERLGYKFSNSGILETFH